METGERTRHDIPADIDQAATRIAGEYMAAPISCAKLYRDVVEALIAERERCAQIADRWKHRDTGYEIAAAIRA